MAPDEVCLRVLEESDWTKFKPNDALVHALFEIAAKLKDLIDTERDTIWAKEILG